MADVTPENIFAAINTSFLVTLSILVFCKRFLSIFLSKKENNICIFSNASRICFSGSRKRKSKKYNQHSRQKYYRFGFVTTIMKDFFSHFYKAIGAVVYWAVGYAFGEGSDNNPFIGYKHFFLIDTDSSEYASYFSHYVFAATASTIVSGAIAERTAIIGYFAFTTAMIGFIYPVVTHWVWNDNGWLSNLGYIVSFLENQVLPQINVIYLFFLNERIMLEALLFIVLVVLPL